MGRGVPPFGCLAARNWAHWQRHVCCFRPKPLRRGGPPCFDLQSRRVDEPMITPSIDCYVPTHCSRCARSFLAALRPGADAQCSSCGGLAHVVPGEVYRAEDAVLFAEIEAAFNSVGLPLTETVRIVTELGNVTERTHSPHTLLVRMLLPVPGLQFLEPTHPGEDARLVRGMGMLLAIAAARVQQASSDQG